MWMSGDNLLESFLSVYRVHSGHRSKVARRDGKDFYPLKCLSVPLLTFVRFYFIFNCAHLCTHAWTHAHVCAHEDKCLRRPEKGCLIALN